MKYMTSAEAAKKWGLSQRRVSLLCSEGRIKDAVKVGKSWILPEFSEKPADARRVQSGDHDDLDDFENICSFDESVAEYGPSYGVPNGVRVSPELLRSASIAASRRGENLGDLINEFLDRLAHDKVNRRIGMAKGVFTCCEDIDFCNDEIAKMFGV